MEIDGLTQTLIDAEQGYSKTAAEIVTRRLRDETRMGFVWQTIYSNLNLRKVTNDQLETSDDHELPVTPGDPANCSFAVIPFSQFGAEELTPEKPMVPFFKIATLHDYVFHIDKLATYKDIRATLVDPVRKDLERQLETAFLRALFHAQGTRGLADIRVRSYELMSPTIYVEKKRDELKVAGMLKIAVHLIGNSGTFTV